MGIDAPKGVTAKRPGPEPTDISLLTRNRLWAWVVYFCTSEIRSWDALDTRWLAMIDGGTPTEGTYPEQRGRRRIFQRYLHVGNDPGRTRGINGRYLIDVVHEDPGQLEAKELYKSSLWELTAPVEPTLTRVDEIQQDLMRQLGLVRLTSTECTVAAETGFAHFATNSSDIETIRNCAFAIALYGSVDAIALLGCCYRLALDRLSLKEADAYLDAIRFALDTFHERWYARGCVIGALRVLIEVRLVRRHPEPVSPELLGFKVRHRHRGAGIPAWRQIQWHDIPSQLSFEPVCLAPIVTPDDAISSFFRQFPAHYRDARLRISTRFSEMDQEGGSTITIPNADEQRASRERMIDKLWLGPLEIRPGFGVTHEP